jgi:hypothetical protein
MEVQKENTARLLQSAIKLIEHDAFGSALDLVLLAFDRLQGLSAAANLDEVWPPRVNGLNG